MSEILEISDVSETNVSATPEKPCSKPHSDFDTHERKTVIVFGYYAVSAT